MFRIRLLITMLVALFVSGAAFAQVTTAGLSGGVSSEDGAVIGGHVRAVHTPSGTVYSAVTNAKGQYTIQGMRPGGPYTVEFSYLGYEKETVKGITLSLGETYEQSVKLTNSKTQLGEAEVVAQAAGRSRTGAAENFNLKAIETAPTISRSVYDIVQLTPQVGKSKIGGISFVGSNNRYNSFQIDGTMSNDVFGLAGSGTNGGQTGANPISLDAIEEIQVVVAPFDVRQSGFTGGGINAITKSGTNEFKGSAYVFYNNQDFYGRYSQAKDSTMKLDKQHSINTGFTLGGPIIKNKLFFFASLDYSFETYSSIYRPGYTSTYINDEQAKLVADRYAAVTGITETYGPKSVDQKSLGLLARIDYNINDRNKLALRYQFSDSYSDVWGSGSSSYYFANSGYRFKNKTNSIVAELTSQITPTLHNELRASLTLVRDKREVGNNGPTVQISNLGNNKTDATASLGYIGNVTGNIGSEYSSGANSLNQNIYTIEDNLSWYKGRHTFTFGTHNEFYRMENLFIQGSNGAFYYRNLDAFLNDNAYRFVYNYSDYDLTGTYRWAAVVKAGQFGFYAQDKWSPTQLLSLTYGLRFDIPVMFNEPTANDEFNASTYATTYGVRVGEVPSAKLMVSPRIGVRYYTDETRRTLLRGGMGLFTGRAPFVWISNAFSNTGMEMKGTTISSNVPKFSEYALDPVGAMNSATGSASRPNIATVSKKFRFPQVFRVNLGWEQQLPHNVKFTLDAIYSKTLNNIYFENLALTESGSVYAAGTGVEASAMPRFTSNTGSYYSIINLKNTSKGYTYAITGKLEKSFDFGLDLMAAYTFGHSYSVFDGTSSVAYSNWAYNYAVNTNAPTMSNSSFDIPHRVVLQATYTTPRYLRGLMATTVSVVYNGSSGQRYSLTMNESVDLNNDGRYGNSLLYIPTADELTQMTFASEDDRTAYGNWIEGNKYARTHRGQFAERNGALAPWENHFDLHVAQDLFVLKEKGSKIQVVFDIVNFTNLLNKKWGTYYSNSYNVSPLRVNSVAQTATGSGIYVPTYTYNGDALSKSDVSSRWHAQIGVRLVF